MSSVREILNRPVVRLLVTIGNDPTIDRTFTMADAAGPLAVLKEGPQPWMKNPRHRWDHPQQPVTYSLQVREGDRALALAWLAQLGPSDDVTAGSDA